MSVRKARLAACGHFLCFAKDRIMTVQVIKGHIVHAPAFGKLDVLENGCIVSDNGKIAGVFQDVPEQYKNALTVDYGDRMVMPSFADTHMHAPQYAMLGMGMDLPLLDWLNTYTFNTEAAFKDTAYAREVYRALAREMIANGTTRVCAFSSLHRESTMILMEEFENAGLTGYVGKVNMDRNSGDVLTETTEESMRETMLWLAGRSVGQIRPRQTDTDPAVHADLHERTDGFSGQAGGGKETARPIAPVRKHVGNRVGQGTAPRLRPILGKLRQIRAVQRPHRDGALRPFRRPRTQSDEGQRRVGRALPRFQRQPDQRHRPRAPNGQRGRARHAGVGHRGRRAVGDEQSRHGRDPRVKGQTHRNELDG